MKAHMHCEACAEAIKKRILRMKGVENVEPDFKGSQVTVRGVFDPQNLVDYVAKKTGKRAVVVKVEPKKEEAAGEEEKKAEEGKAEEGKKGGDGDGGEKKEGESGGGEKKEGDGEGVELAEDPKMEYPPIQVNNNPHYHHHQRFVAAQDGGGYGYGYPQMFSDENPNACSVM
nr:heavy metal-associated isoprenylated plant protein 7-like [Ipomoea batatas]